MEAYLHVDVSSCLLPKRGGVCGDVVRVERDASATTVICADGLGSGAPANLAATMTASRALELLRQGFSLRQAMARLVTSLNRSRGESSTYTAFTIARIRRDGATSIVGYDAPPALLVPKHGGAQVLTGRPEMVGEAMVSEANCFLQPGEAVVLMSDGVTQAGLGRGLPEGWTPEGLARWLKEERSTGARLDDLATAIAREARRLWGATQGDDVTAVVAGCRKGDRVSILTGPPASRQRDDEVVRRFVMMPGRKVICGGSTAQMAARVLRRKVIVSAEDGSEHTPPSYRLAGVDLVTEGAVSLNQLVNILDSSPEEWPAENPVCELGRLLLGADRIDILQGTASNPAGGDFVYRQLGVLARQHVVPLLAERLREQGKVVVLESV